MPSLRAGWHPYTSEEPKCGVGGVGRLVTRCWQAISGRWNYNGPNGQIYYAVISKGALGTSVQDSPKGRMALATFAAVHVPPLYVLSALLAVPGFIGWVLPYFVYQKNIVNGLTDDELAKINSFRDKLEQALRDIVDGEDTQVKVAKRLFPIVKDETKLSKILAYGGSDKRHVNLKLMVALRRVYGLDINKLVDEL